MIAIIQYNAGNLQSVENAMKRLGVDAVLTSDKEEISKADKVIFPGVGEASTAMQFLKENGLDELIPKLEQPVLGICLGLQLLCKYSEEGDTPCLGVFDNEVKRFPNEGIVPHMGWNSFDQIDGPLYEGIDPKQDVYYVHGYYAEVNEFTNATCNYIRPFSAGLQKDNFYATQFHPEKSADIGERILQNFLAL